MSGFDKFDIPDEYIEVRELNHTSYILNYNINSVMISTNVFVDKTEFIRLKIMDNIGECRMHYSITDIGDGHYQLKIISSIDELTPISGMKVLGYMLKEDAPPSIRASLEMMEM